LGGRSFYPPTARPSHALTNDFRNAVSNRVSDISRPGFGQPWWSESCSRVVSVRAAQQFSARNTPATASRDEAGKNKRVQDAVRS
jgi:hypothetical protein